MRFSWLIPSAELRDAGDKGRGVFATANIPAGTTVAGFGGFVADRAEFASLDPHRQTHSLQIDDGLFMVCSEQPEPADFLNHSCEPNCGILGTVLLVTLRDVAEHEELTFDYAMCDDDPYDEFECACGAPTCRMKVTGNDWMLPELHDRYAGNFSTYLARRIATLNAD
ncbi:MAG: SET domain-containing protein [Actinomycetes bacterium]